MPPTSPEPTSGHLDATELLLDFPQAAAIVVEGVNSFKALPKPTKAVDYADAMGFLPGSVVHGACAAFDTLKGGHVTVDEISTLLGVAPDKLLGHSLELAKTIAAQAAS